MNEEYQQIEENKVPPLFKIIKNKVYLQESRASPITVNFPLVFDENIAKIAAMLLDGSLSKTLSCCTFSQKKDPGKMSEIREITKEYFGITGNFMIDKKSGSHIVSYPKVFSHFLYYCVGMYKCDQFASIPYWIWKSPLSVTREYLRYGFAMEGSIKDPKKGREIRFHSCDLLYVKELRTLLSVKFGITSKIGRYHIKDYGWKYYLYFEKSDEVIRFYNNIGFALDSHQERLRRIVEHINSKAWEITLVKLLDLNEEFKSKEVHKLFPYLSYRAINQRLIDLVTKGYVCSKKEDYALTREGVIKAILLKGTVRIVRLRSDPQCNEMEILIFLNRKGSSYISEMARELGINPITIRGVLKRLQAQDKIKLASRDKFQRIFYRLVDKENLGGKNPPSGF